jgi:uncharacterized membrane protein HdeD (DUF308 family)
MSNVDRVPRSAPDDLSASRFRWVGFLALGIVLLLCGSTAMLMPAVSTVATSKVLGAALTIAGVVTIVQTSRVKAWSGYIWQRLCGAAETVGGLLIWFNPMKGAAAVALLVAIVLLSQGVALIGLALKIRPQRGWAWLCVAGLVSLTICASLVLRFPFASVEAPGAIAGLALALGGIAYVAMAIGWMQVGSGQAK